MYSKQVFAILLTPFGFISVFRLTALLKLEITVYFLWLLLPVHSGSLTRIHYSKLYNLAHPLSFKYFTAQLTFIIFILLMLDLIRNFSFTTELQCFVSRV